MILRLLLVTAILFAAETTFADVMATGDGGTITDNTTLISEIRIDERSIISEATFCLDNIFHSYVGDLTVSIEHVDSGTTVTLFDRVDRFGSGNPGDSSNLNGLYIFENGGSSFWEEASAGASNYDMAPGTYGASDEQGNEVDLNVAFAGLNTRSLWRLTIEDGFVGDEGTLDQWSMELRTGIPEPGSAVVLIGLGLATLSRRRK